jgi:GNAT superfamily N-acetyltransferase
MKMFEYDVPVARVNVEAKALFQQHWEELALNKEKIALNYDVAKAQTLQDNGMLKNILAYKDGKLVGYAILIMQPHLHYADHVYAFVDVIYVLPEYRGSTIGARLMFETERIAKDAGASVILHHAKPYVPAIIKPLEKMNYSLYEHIYGKYRGE